MRLASSGSRIPESSLALLVDEHQGTGQASTPPVPVTLSLQLATKLPTLQSALLQNDAQTPAARVAALPPQPPLRQYDGRHPVLGLWHVTRIAHDPEMKHVWRTTPPQEAWGCCSSDSSDGISTRGSIADCALSVLGGSATIQAEHSITHSITLRNIRINFAAP